MTIEELQREIETLQAEIETLQDEIAADEERIKPKRRRVDSLQDRLVPLLVEAWFREHPDKRIAIGDELAVTDEYMAIIRERRFPIDSFTRNLRVYEIARKPDSWMAIHVTSDGGGSGFPLDVVIGMRQAYLEQEATQ